MFYQEISSLFSAQDRSHAVPAELAPRSLLDSARGLPSNQIHRIAADPLRRLWTATPAGLSCFDGSFVRCWDRSDGLHCVGLRSVATDAGGNVWIGTDLGLERLDASGQIMAGVPVEQWRYGLCQDIDASGSAPWMGTAQGLLRLKAVAVDQPLEIDYHAAIGFVSDVILIDEAHVLAASDAHGLVMCDGERWWPSKCAELLNRRVTRLAQVPARGVLVGTDAGAVLVDTLAERCLAVFGSGDLQVTALAVDRQVAWIAAGRELFAVALEGQVGRILERCSLQSSINDLYVDELGNLWIGTNNSGLAQISCLRFALARIDLGQSGGVYSIRADEADRVMLGGEALFGSVSLPPGVLRAPLAPAVGLNDTTVWDSHVDANGTWVATQNGLYLATDGEFRREQEDDATLAGPARVLCAQGGELWIGTLLGLACLRDGRVVPQLDEAGEALGYVYAINAGADGELWISTLGRGLWRYQNALQPVCSAPLSSSGNTYAAERAADGRMLILQDDKVVMRASDGGLRLLAELPPVAGWCALWIDQRTVAIGSSQGLRLLDVESGTIRRCINSLFELRDWEFTNNRSLHRQRDGSLLCGVNGGLFRVDLQQLQKFLAPPECSLLEIDWRDCQPERGAAAFRLAAGRWSFRVRVFSAWWVDHGKVNYQFQLVGFDRDWQALTAYPELSFNSLPPGRYRLLARAHSPLAGAGPEVELLRLEVTTSLLTRAWIDLLSLIDNYVIRPLRLGGRNRALHQRYQRLEHEVAQRTESLRAANRQLESMRDAYKRLSEVDGLTGLGNRRQFDAELARAIALARRLQAPLALLLLDIDHFKMVNDRHGHQVGDDHLRAVGEVLAATVREGEDVATRYGGEEFALLLINTDRGGARIFAERVRSAIEALRLVNQGAPGAVVTVSIGVAVMSPMQAITAEQLIERADAALYRAKRGGRNRVEDDSDH